MKRKILACVLACATLFLGMGYAYWTDSLQLETTATTGELEVKFVDLALYGQYAGQDNETGWAVVDGITPNGYTADWFFQRAAGGGANVNVLADAADLQAYNDRIWGYTKTNFDADLVNPIPIDVTIDGYTAGQTNGSSKIAIAMNQIYPGFAQVYQTDIINTGTIAAKLADLEFDVTEFANVATKDMIGVSMEILREYAKDEGHVPVFHTDNLSPADKFTVAGVEFIRLSSLETLMAGPNAPALLNETIYVLPDNSRMDLYIGIAMDPDKVGNYTSGSTAALSGKDDSATENRSVKFNVEFLFDQFNIDVPEGGSNEHLGDPLPH
ncbi:MAG: signal peptide protein [Eubacteriales bacterium]|nr:signal peptide protein [Eubacteriales bacterium]MDD3199872.1 signal peptide protein [Eubacteriales bacterium]MDD4121731.1 signal peptide protein [Eubacteriales bacterium]MDD4630264.1 signal peptide protein [Eubacteriales bacterium]